MRSLVVFLMLSLVACATTPLTINQAAVVPESRILAPQWLAQASNTGSLVVKRDSGFMGSACTIRVFVDSVVATSNGICGGGTSEAAVVIMPERQRILRIASGQSGDIFLQPSAF